MPVLRILPVSLQGEYQQDTGWENYQEYISLPVADKAAKPGTKHKSGKIDDQVQCSGSRPENSNEFICQQSERCVMKAYDKEPDKGMDINIKDPISQEGNIRMFYQAAHYYVHILVEQDK